MSKMDKEILKANKKLYAAVVARNAIGVEEALSEGARVDYFIKSTFVSALFGGDEHAYESMISIAVQGSVRHHDQESDRRVISVLLNHGADINEKTGGNRTLLCFALYQRNLGMAEFLFQNGADPLLKCDSGHNAFYYADAAGFYDFLDLMQGKTAKNQTKKLQENNGTQKIEDEKICFFDTLGDMSVEYWYNFEIEERITLIRDPKNKKVQQMDISPFTEISKSALTKAFNEYKERGGKKELNDMHPMLKDKPAYMHPKSP